MRLNVYKSPLTASIILSSAHFSQAAHHITVDAVADNFAQIASAMYEDSLISAQSLQQAVNMFVEDPSMENLALAKQAYKEARAPYQQAEVLRFDAENGHVTPDLDSDGGIASADDWEGQLNAWPLDEALIDYIDSSLYEGGYNEQQNIINSFTELSIGSQKFDTTIIDSDLLISLNEVGGSESNVATGIHAVEFLLWGQDLNGTEAGAGDRPVSDYYTAENGECTSGQTIHSDDSICQRRGQYLSAVTDLYVDDLQKMVNEWSVDARQTEGTLGYDYLNNGQSIARIVDSVGDMAAGELASERMKVAVLFGSTEDEHDCFSDLTHIAIYNNSKGLLNAYRGEYTRLDGTEIKGPSLKDLIAEKDTDLSNNLDDKLTNIDAQMQAIVDLAEDEQNPIKFDQIVDGSAEQKQMVLGASDALVAFADELGDNINTILSIQTNEFDKGTCPGGSVEDCDAE